MRERPGPLRHQGPRPHRASVNCGPEHDRRVQDTPQSTGSTLRERYNCAKNWIAWHSSNPPPADPAPRRVVQSIRGDDVAVTTLWRPLAAPSRRYALFEVPTSHVLIADDDVVVAASSLNALPGRGREGNGIALALSYVARRSRGRTERRRGLYLLISVGAPAGRAVVVVVRVSVFITAASPRLH